jgi:NAD(P)-dependent dehydrogenase (short-subunit alcohol dehydrogenase family)
MGAQVLVHYNSGAKEAEAVVAEIRKVGGRAERVASDLSAPDGAHKLAKQVRAVVGDRLDILVANAGASKSATIEETTVEDFDRLFAVNVRTPFFLVQQLLPIMCKDSSIVLISSLAGHAAVGTLPPTQRPRAPSTRWSSTSRPLWASAEYASMLWRPARSLLTCRVSRRRMRAGSSRSASRP